MLKTCHLFLDHCSTYCGEGKKKLIRWVTHPEHVTVIWVRANASFECTLVCSFKHLIACLLLDACMCVNIYVFKWSTDGLWKPASSYTFIYTDMMVLLMSFLAVVIKLSKIIIKKLGGEKSEQGEHYLMTHWWSGCWSWLKSEDERRTTKLSFHLLGATYQEVATTWKQTQPQPEKAS